MATVTRKRRSSAFMEAEPRTKKGDTDSEPVTPETPVAGRKHVDAKVEHAKSGRSTCRVCNSAIQQGDVRIGLDVEMSRRAPGIVVTGWRHLQCFKPPTGMTLEHIHGLDSLSPKERSAVERHLRDAAAEQKHKPSPRAAAEPAKPQAKHPETVAARGIEGKKVAAKQAKKHAHPGDARFQLTSSGDEEAMRAKYTGMSTNELKEVLRANEQLLSGSKDELVERCVDGELHGGLPQWCVPDACPTQHPVLVGRGHRGSLTLKRSPQCGIGRLKADADGTYVCPGYFDNTAKVYVRCEFSAGRGGVTRTRWVMPGGETQHAPGKP